MIFHFFQYKLQIILIQREPELQEQQINISPILEEDLIILPKHSFSPSPPHFFNPPPDNGIIEYRLPRKIKYKTNINLQLKI
jgi:hypothetical protein